MSDLDDGVWMLERLAQAGHPGMSALLVDYNRLRRAHTRPTHSPTPDPTTITWYVDPPAAVAVASTPGTSWQPGGWVDQLAAEVD